MTAIHTIGHSDHSMEDFVGLLRQHRITLVIDVRSQPYSRWVPQFNRETLERDLKEAGIFYEFMGEALGGRPDDPAGHTPESPDYRRLEQTDAYRRGIDRLIDVADDQRVVIMCGEGDYLHCHRHLLISQTLLKRDIEVLHIKPDGQVATGELIPEQLSLF